VAALRERFPDMVILHGIEVDIMPDGLLDFPDSVLETLDIVLASLHDRAGHDPATLTRRLLGAIAHPLVNVITHPLNQLVGRDTGYDMDFLPSTRQPPARAPRWRSTAPPGTSTSTARMRAKRLRRGSPSRSTATATGRGCSTGRCAWGSAPPGAGGSSPATC